MITILHRGGGSLGTPKSDYVICARPLTGKIRQIVFEGLPLIALTQKIIILSFLEKRRRGEYELRLGTDNPHSKDDPLSSYQGFIKCGCDKRN